MLDGPNISDFVRTLMPNATPGELLEAQENLDRVLDLIDDWADAAQREAERRQDDNPPAIDTVTPV